MPEILQCEQDKDFSAAPGKVLYFILDHLERNGKPPFRFLLCNGFYPLLIQTAPPDMGLAELDTFIDDDPTEPCTNGAGLFQLPEAPEGLYKPVLQDILGVCRTPRHPDTDIIHKLA